MGLIAELQRLRKDVGSTLSQVASETALSSPAHVCYLLCRAKSTQVERRAYSASQPWAPVRRESIPIEEPHGFCCDCAWL